MKQAIYLIAGAALLASCAATPHGETRRFQAQNRFEIDVPAGAQSVHGWFALPDDNDALQELKQLDIRTDVPDGAVVKTEQVRDEAGNRFLYLDAKNAAGKRIVLETNFELERHEALNVVDANATRPLTAKERAKFAPYLTGSTNVVATAPIAAAAREAVAGNDNPVAKARLLYDWTLDHVQYWVKFPDRMKSSGVGSSVYCFEQCTGNCTDFHSLYSAAAQATGLPTRMVYGSFFKGPLEGEDADQSYHCWIEFWAPQLGWIPLDVAVADVFVDDFALDDDNRRGVSLTLADGYAGPDAAMVDYYFGNLDARRVTWNRGRDLVLAGASGPINALPKAHVEVDGVPLKEKAGWTRKLTFHEVQ